MGAHSDLWKSGVYVIFSEKTWKQNILKSTSANAPLSSSSSSSSAHKITSSSLTSSLSSEIDFDKDDDESDDEDDNAYDVTLRFGQLVLCEHSIKEAAIEILKGMERRLLFETLSVLKDGSINEIQLQRMFYTSAACNPKFKLNAQVPSAEKGKAPIGYVDFVERYKKFGIEFMQGGRDLVAHEKRFDKNDGSYRHLDLQDWIVIDFRRESGDKPVVNHDNLLVVVYPHNVKNFTVYSKGNGNPITF